MAWKIKDEWIDLRQSRHVVLFHNPDTGAEHQLIHEFNVPACPHCGHPHMIEQKPVDFESIKAEVHAALHAHHRRSMEYHEKHKNVRLGTGPKA